MFKKDMTPLQPHSRPGSLHASPNKASAQRSLPGARGGGPASFQSYGKSTPMMDGTSNMVDMGKFGGGE